VSCFRVINFIFSLNNSNIRFILPTGKTPAVYKASHTNTIERVNDDEFIAAQVFETAEVPITEADLLEEAITKEALNEKAEHDEMLIIPDAPSIEDDGLQYALGFIARKIKNKYPQLGSYSYLNQNEHDYGIVTYVDEISHGGLTVPSTYMMTEGRKLNHEMKQLHKDKFAFKKHIIKRTHNMIVGKELTTLPEEVSLLFVKLFIKFRINRLNQVINEKNMKKRAAAAANRKSKAAKKIQKLST
jgi:hypothetical protein